MGCGNSDLAKEKAKQDALSFQVGDCEGSTAALQQNLKPARSLASIHVSCPALDFTVEVDLDSELPALQGVIAHHLNLLPQLSERLEVYFSDELLSNGRSLYEQAVRPGCTVEVTGEDILKAEDLWLREAMAARLFQAAGSGDVPCLKELLEANCSVDTPTVDQSVCGGIALLAAAHGGHYEAVEFLLDANASAETSTPAGSTPLRLAANNSHHRVVNLLLSSISSVDEPGLVESKSFTDHSKRAVRLRSMLSALGTSLLLGVWILTILHCLQTRLAMARLPEMSLAS